MTAEQKLAAVLAWCDDLDNHASDPEGFTCRAVWTANYPDDAYLRLMFGPNVTRACDCYVAEIRSLVE